MSIASTTKEVVVDMNDVFDQATLIFQILKTHQVFHTIDEFNAGKRFIPNLLERLTNNHERQSHHTTRFDYIITDKIILNAMLEWKVSIDDTSVTLKPSITSMNLHGIKDDWRNSYADLNREVCQKLSLEENPDFTDGVVYHHD